MRWSPSTWSAISRACARDWSEATLAPADWFRFGIVTQRTRVYRSDRQIQRGVMAGVSFRYVNVTGYVFNPDQDTRFVLAIELAF